MTAAIERKMGQRNTRAFIQADPSRVTLIRPTKVLTAAGGHKPGEPITLPPQTVRLVPLSGNVWDRSKQKTDEGNLPDVTFQLVGMPGLDIKKGDHFVWKHDDWEVIHVSPEEGQRISANISLRSQVA